MQLGFVCGGLLSPTPLICVCLQGFGPAVLLSGLCECPGLAGFVLSSLISSPDSFFSCLLPTEPRLQVE